jgi:prolyl-tRNA editing enzyme YbaK/EbsC (Cys-tRNA(Pro) deacylase)
VVLDEDLQRFAAVWAAAGTPYSVFPLSPAQLQRLTGAAWSDVKA